MFEHFAVHRAEVGGTSLHALVGGSGPAVLLLHGYPQTHVMWHRVAPVLARRHTVVTPDLRGYGDSAKPAGGSNPAGGAEHVEYGKRAMAADQLELMRGLGFDRFAVVGHDRGARVAHRLCLDHPDAVSRAAVLDVVPTRHMFRTVDRTVAEGYYHWFFLAQPHPLPERLLEAAPEHYLRSKLDRWSAVPDAFAAEAISEYLRCFADPAAIHASCEDYRAAATIDLDHDEADAAAGRGVDCPLLVLWGARSFVGQHYDVEHIWRQYATDVRTSSLDCGHFLPEEAPESTGRALADFLAQPN